ncbi:hypothetical protein [Streptomyces sp. NPDC086787]|uniref:hypothetical protein n=1 Tax=Streptomyces sp. NPDC086787 TaxID=3365759 RepID=UPI00380BD35F
MRIDGELGREVADRLARMTGGDPGPVVESDSGRRCVYFLVAPGSTARHSWPRTVTRLVSGPFQVSFIPVPAMRGLTWPLGWRYPPSAADRRVHTLLLRNALSEAGAFEGGAFEDGVGDGVELS